MSGIADVAEAIVPGSAAAGSAAYVSALLRDLPAPARALADTTLAALGAALDGGRAAIEEVARRDPEGFALVRALAVEAYYSGYRHPGAPGPDAWTAIDFSTPVTEREVRDYGFLRIAGG